MLQLLLFLSTRISNFGDSICQFAHGVFAFTLFNRTRDFRSTPTLSAGPSLLVDSPIKFPGPSQSWSPRFFDDRSATDDGPDSFIARGFSRASDILGFEGPMFIKLLIFALVLSVICMPFVMGLGDLFDVLRSWVHSVPASLLASVHATGVGKMSHMDEELAKKLDSDLQQIKHGSAQIQSLSTENRALNSLAIGQGAAIRTQSDLINQLQGQLRDHGHNLEQAVSYWEQCERDVLMNSQEVARLEERIAALTVDSDMAQSASRLNRRHAQAREDRLRSALQAIEVHLSETQTSLCVSKESSIRQHEFFLSELETYAKQLDHWKTAAEQFGTKALDSERDVLNLRKELGVAYRNAREAKEQLESQTTVLGERDATIRSLDRELADVRDQVQNAQYEIESLRSDLESVDAAWKPLDSVDGFELTDKLPAILGWRGWLTEGTPDAPAMFVLRPQLVPHSPDMSIEELICASSSPSSQSTPAPSTEILSCSNSHVIQPTDIDDPFLDSFLPQPCSQLSGISHTPRDATTSFAALRSHLNNAEIINELREQLADELLTRALIEDQVTRLQMKLLATEAVVVVQRRQLSSQQSQLSNQQSQLSNQQSQLSNQQSQLSTQQSQLSSQQSQLSSQQSQLSEEAAKNASLCEQSRSLVVERDAMAARIAVLEAGLVDRQAEEMAAAKAADEVRAELEQAKQTLSAYVNESRSLVAERNAIAERIAVLEAGVVDRQAEETAAAEAANEVHAELEQTKKILRAYVKESRSLVVERNAMAERIAVLEAGLVERQAEEIAAAKAADEVRAELKQTKKTLRAYTKESRSLVVERNAMAARIAVLEAGLAEREVEEMAAAKAADEVHAELEQTKQTLRAYVKESRSLVVERDAMAERIAVLEAGLVERQAEEMAAAAKAADEVHAELEQTKQTLRAYVKESRSLVAERDAMAERIAALEAVLVERQAEEMAAAKAADEVQAELVQTKETLYACVNEVDAVKTERDELDMRLSQAIFLSTALQDKVATLEQKIANAVVTPSNGSHEGDCRPEQDPSGLQDRVETLEQKIANDFVTLSDGPHEGGFSPEQVSPAFQHRVKTLEQKIANDVVTPSDGPHEGDCSLELVVSESIPYLLDMSLPSLSSWGSVPDHPLPNPKLQSAITASKAGPQLRTSPVPGRRCSPPRITPPRSGCVIDGLVPSESSLSLLLASTPPMPLPDTPPIPSSPRFSYPDLSSPSYFTRCRRPADNSPMPILGRVAKRRSPPPSSTSRPPRPMGRQIAAPH